MFTFSKMAARKRAVCQSLVIFSLTIIYPLSAWACSSCGCTLSPEWISEGYTAKPGLNLDLRYDFLEQGQLRSGTHAVSRNPLAFPNANEVELVPRAQFYNVALE